MTEHEEQKTVVQWCKVNNITVAAVPNGFFTQKRDGKFYGMLNKLKAEGYSPGFPDLLVFLKSKLLLIEMKVKSGGTVSDRQKEWHDTLKQLGFFVSVCNGAEEAIEVIKGNL